MERLYELAHMVDEFPRDDQAAQALLFTRM
jgi:hypothetical protein